MTQLSGGAVVALMHNAGFPESAFRIGAAVAYAESSWRTDLVNQNTDGPKSKDLGLWQINDHWHPTEIASGDWRNPVDNTRMAKKLYDVSGLWGGWSTWVTYSQGHYKKHLQRADQAIAEWKMAVSSAGGNKTIAANNILQNNNVNTDAAFFGENPALDKLGDAIKVMSDPTTYIRAAMVIGGAGLTIAGLLFMFKNSKMVSDVAKTAASIIPVGKVGKVVSKVVK